MNKKILSSLLISCLLTLTSCSHIEDSNGIDNFSLQTITNQQIIESNNHLLQFSKSWSSDVNGTRSSKLSASKFSGVKELHSIYLNNESITYAITSEVYSGNFLICIVNKDKILETISANETKEITLREITGKCTLKIAGESANFKMEYKIY